MSPPLSPPETPADETPPDDGCCRATTTADEPPDAVCAPLQLASRDRKRQHTTTKKMINANSVALSLLLPWCRCGRSYYSSNNKGATTLVLLLASHRTTPLSLLQIAQCPPPLAPVTSLLRCSCSSPRSAAVITLRRHLPPSGRALGPRSTGSSCSEARTSPPRPCTAPA